MSEQLVLSKRQARQIILDAAGLSRTGQFGFGKAAVYEVIKHLGFVQLDTNLVVERAHHHVFASRVPDYQTSWLTELCDEGLVFEYFASDAGYMPMYDFRYTLPVKQAFELNRPVLKKPILHLMAQIMDQVERDGAVRVSDFENDRQEASSGWWDWRPAKVALERLYLEGKLMIRRDKKFQKVYELPLNLVPDEIDQTLPTAAAYARYIIHRTLSALGIGAAKELRWRSRRVTDNAIKAELDKMILEGAVFQVQVEGLKDVYYMLKEQNTAPVTAGDVFILSPFDILNVFRHRLKDFFNFDYQLECFVPAAKRQYGYFSLPVLAGDRFIARMDAKANRKNKLLIVHNIHFEAVEISDSQLDKFIHALRVYILFNQCRDVLFIKSNTPAYLSKLQTAFG